MKPTRIIKNLIIFLIVIIFLAHSYGISQINPQKGRLEGQVLNKNEEPIKDAKVLLKNAFTKRTFQTLTDKNGNYSSGNIPPGEYSITVSKQGYKTYQGEVEVKSNTIGTLDIILAEEPTAEQKNQKKAVEHFKKGVELTQENKTAEAIQSFQKAVEMNPDFFEAYMNLGLLFFREKMDAKAEKAILKALELKPDNNKPQELLVNIYIEKAKNLIQEEKYDQALETLKKAYDYNNDNSYVNYLLGYLYYKEEIKEKAIQHLDKFLELDPNAPQNQIEIVNKLLKELKEK